MSSLSNPDATLQRGATAGQQQHVLAFDAREFWGNRAIIELAGGKAHLEGAKTGTPLQEASGHLGSFRPLI